MIPARNKSLLEIIFSTFQYLKMQFSTFHIFVLNMNKSIFFRLLKRNNICVTYVEILPIKSHLVLIFCLKTSFTHKRKLVGKMESRNLCEDSVKVFWCNANRWKQSKMDNVSKRQR